MGKVLCYGVVGVDYLLSVRAFPEADGHARISSEEVVVGGEAANTAVRLSQLGCSVLLFGNPVGSDRHGDLFTSEMSGTDVDSRIQTQQGATGHAYVVRDEAGTRTILGAFDELVGPEIPADCWDGVKHVAIDPFVKGALEVAKYAHSSGIPVTAIELGPGNEMLPFADTVINSAGFMRRHEWGEHRACTHSLLSMGVQSVIITQGSAGADVYTESGVFRQPAFPVEAVDTTGAGDAFRAGWIEARMAGRSQVDAARNGAAVAALSCCYLGGCGGSVALDEARRLAGVA